jgi:hypothetical protein
MRSVATVLSALAWVTIAIAANAEPPPSPPTKAATAATRLLLPMYTVDTVDPTGSTTILAVRNQIDMSTMVVFRYYSTDRPQAPQHSETVILPGKAVHPVNIAFIEELAADADGIARGYVIIEGLDPWTSIQGDYFQVSPGEDFATGFRLVNTTPASSHYELCSLFTVRFLNGGPFDGGTRLVIWRELDVPSDPGETAFSVAVYDEPGELLMVRDFQTDQTVLDISANEVLQPLLSTEFGVFEFQFGAGVVGHVSAQMSAEGRYSVGLEASCGDFD